MKKRVLCLIMMVCVLFAINSVYADSTSTAGTTQLTETVSIGDVNDDGSVNSIDLVLLKRYILGTNQDINVKNADLDQNGMIDSTDLVLLKKKILGISSDVPVTPKVSTLAFVTGVMLVGDNYNISAYTSEGYTNLILPKANPSVEIRNLEKDFILYEKENDSVTIKAAFGASFDSNGNIIANEIMDLNNAISSINGSVDYVDGNMIKVLVADGSYVLLNTTSDVKVIKATVGNNTMEIDSAVISDLASLSTDNKVTAFVNSDNKVCALYYIR